MTGGQAPSGRSRPWNGGEAGQGGVDAVLREVKSVMSPDR